MASRKSKQPLIPPPPGVEPHPDGKGWYGYHPKYGYPICGSTDTFDGQPCMAKPRDNRRRCRHHGGNAVSGEAHYNYKHGEYIPRNKRLPPLGVLIEQNLTDEGWLSMQGEVAALRARFEQQIQRIATMQPSIAAKQGKEAQKALQDGISLLEEAVLNPTNEKSPDLIRQARGKFAESDQLLRDALKRSRVEIETWDELRDTSASIKNMLAHELQRERIEKNYISGVDLVRFLNLIRDVIIEKVPDVKVRMAIVDKVNSILMEQKLLVSDLDDSPKE